MGSRTRRQPDPAFATPAGAIIGLAGHLQYALEPCGITLWQYHILAFCQNRPATPSEVATWRAVKKQTVSRHLNSLVELDLLRRDTDPRDRRRIVHNVTDAGIRTLLEASQAMDRALESVLGELPKARAEVAREGIAEAGLALDARWFGGSRPVPTPMEGQRTRPGAGGDADRTLDSPSSAATTSERS